MLASPATKSEIIRYNSPALRSEESLKSQSGECFSSNQFVNIELAAQRPLLNDAQGEQMIDLVMFLSLPLHGTYLLKII